MNLTAKNLFYVMCVVLGLGIVGVCYSLYWANGQLSLRADEINALNLQADNLDKQIINANKLSTQLENNNDIIAIADEVLPKTKTQENIVGELISIASNRSIILEGINFIGGSSGIANPITQTDKVDGIAGVYSIGVTTSFETSYDNLLQLLRDLEGNKRRFEVTEIDIAPIKNELGDVISYASQLTILTYVRP